jgi:predicted O-methyltransferase YrrM
MLAPDIQRVIERLYAETLAEDAAVREAARVRGLLDDGHPEFYPAMRDARLPVVPEFGELLYILARTSRARQVVEFGTSFGVSTIFLAAALRDNGGGHLVTTEFMPEKAAVARANLLEAGLGDLVEIRVGDALSTLSSDLADEIDLLFLDATKALYLPILRRVEPRLRSGALVVSDRSDGGGGCGRDAGYLEHLREPTNGYRTASISTQALGMNFEHELAVRL